MDDQKIVINGKEVDIRKMSDDELVEFFDLDQELLEEGIYQGLIH